MKILATATSFGFGPVSKLVAIIKNLQPENEFTVLLSGNSLAYAKENLSSINALFMDSKHLLINSKWIKEISKEYDVLLNVMDFEIQEAFGKADNDDFTFSFFVDSLNWMWDKQIYKIEKNTAYFVQEYKEGNFPLPKNTIIIPKIVDLEIGNNILNKSSTVLVNVAGMFLPDDSDESNVEFIKKYVLFWMSLIPKIVTTFNPSIKIIFALNTEQVAMNLLPNNNPKVLGKVFSHSEFLALATESDIVFSTPGLTFRNESNELGIDVKYLLPTNYSQALLIEDYVKDGSNGLALGNFGDEFKVETGMKEMEGVQFVRSTVMKLLENEAEIHAQMKLWNFIKSKAIRDTSVINGASNVANYIDSHLR